MSLKFISLLRALAAAYQAFSGLSSKHVRAEGLTNAQFDIIATLGQKSSMTPRDLGRETLITKGTLTGVLDRLEEKQLIYREASSSDKRSFKVSLTVRGRDVFDRVFHDHIDFIGPAFDIFSDEQLGEITTQLRALERAFSARAANRLPISNEGDD